MKDFDLVDWEMAIWQKSQGANISVPKQHLDHNWQLLREERLLPPKVVEHAIKRISNVSLMLWANKNYSDGNLACTVYRNGEPEAYAKNLIFSVKPELTPQQYKVWDLVMTDAALSKCQARRCKFYTANHAEDYSAEFAHFEIWRNHKLIWACLLVNDLIIPMNIYMQEHSQGDIRLTAPWAKRQPIDQWYKNNI